MSRRISWVSIRRTIPTRCRWGLHRRSDAAPFQPTGYRRSRCGALRSATVCGRERQARRHVSGRQQHGALGWLPGGRDDPRRGKARRPVTKGRRPLLESRGEAAHGGDRREIAAACRRTEASGRSGADLRANPSGRPLCKSSEIRAGGLRKSGFPKRAASLAPVRLTSGDRLQR